MFWPRCRFDLSGILLCESSDEATSIARAIADLEMVKQIAQKVVQEECTFHVRTDPVDRKGATTMQSILRAKKANELSLEDVMSAESKYSLLITSRSGDLIKSFTSHPPNIPRTNSKVKTLKYFPYYYPA